MSSPSFPDTLTGKQVHFIGAKGTGMAALAEIIAAKGAALSGSDVPDTFYTDAILRSLNMRLSETFSVANLRDDIDIVVYSDAYSAATNPEMAEAARRGLPMFSFAQALGALSRMSDSSGIAGVHGKTTTTAMVGTILGALGTPMTILTGSAVSGFGGRCTMIRGDRYFVAETDEYKRHFMHFSPRRILLTSVESDHQDFYPTYGDILEAFHDYVMLLPAGGLLVYCADDPGAVEVADFAKSRRSDLRFVPYGFSAQGDWRIVECKAEEGRTRFRVASREEPFELRVPGRHLALDAAGALALAADIAADAQGGSLAAPQW
jgi:UDP-N-acetylmuramate--alanine ligase